MKRWREWRERRAAKRITERKLQARKDWLRARAMTIPHER